jgi:ubiquinone/menaquinone biosynthesis C-methylase UbiE
MVDAWTAKYEADRHTRADLDRAASVASVRIARGLLQPGMRVLEGGTGTGRLSVQLAREAAIEVVGLDAAPGAIKLGNELVASAGPLNGEVRFIEGDLYALPFGDATFDVALSDSVIEHLEDPEAALVEFWRVLRPQGLLIVSVPNRWRPDGWDLYRWLAAPAHRQSSFSPPGLRRMVHRAGFAPVSYFGDELWLRRNIALLRTRLAFRPSGSRASGGGGSSSTAPPWLKRIVERLLPARLHVNIGIVARRT